MQTQNVVESRPNLPWWRLIQAIIFLSVVAYYVVITPGRPFWMLSGFAGLVFLVLLQPCGEIILYWPCKIVADQQHLSWSSWRSETRVTWEQVSAYYEDKLRGVDVDKVETEVGPLVLRREWRQAEALKQAIQERATEASTHQWLSKAAYQAANTSRTYEYGSRSVFRNPAVFLLVHAVFTLFFGIRLLTWNSKPGLESMAAAIFVLLFGLLEGGCTIRLLWKLRVAGHSRSLERITVSPGGISWTDGLRNVQAAWSEVQCLRRERLPGFLPPSQWSVETRAGNFTFVESAIRDGSLLLEVIKNHLPPERQITS